MTKPIKFGTSSEQDQEERDRFRRIRYLTNHWSRPIGPQAYYWYLTFEHSPELQAMAQKVQQAISLPYYDLTPTKDLHMTLDRIADVGAISPAELGAVTDVAQGLCSTIAPMRVTVDNLGGTPGAIGLTVYPRQTIGGLRDRLRTATLATHPAANVKPLAFHPHVTIAYCNSDGVDAADAIEAVVALNDMTATELTVDHVSLVLLTRLSRSYKWETVTRLPLLGDACTGTHLGSVPTISKGIN